MPGNQIEFVWVKLEFPSQLALQSKFAMSEMEGFCKMSGGSQAYDHGKANSFDPFDPFGLDGQGDSQRQGQQECKKP